jgi:hypothetical protein
MLCDRLRILPWSFTKSEKVKVIDLGSKNKIQMYRMKKYKNGIINTDKKGSR